jgi:putative transposase
LEALEEALGMNTPEIFNSDQGVQFTSNAFTSQLQSHNVRISMDGVGRCFDNIMVERLWRSVKYEEVYVKDYRSLPEARANINDYFTYYNLERPHQSHNYRTPYEVYHNLEWGSSGSILTPSTTQTLSNILS